LVLSGDTARLTGLIQKDPRFLTAVDPRGNTLLDHAVWAGQPEIAGALIKLGADVNSSDGISSCLHDAIDSRPGGDARIARVLLENGALTEIRATNGWTPLHRACVYASKEFVETLLDFGADIDARTSIDEHLTPLMEAAYAGRDDVVKLLLSRGAAAGLKDTCGRTAEDIATMEKHENVTQAFSEWRNRGVKGGQDH
jgi:ankyrin repeat protein